MPPASPAVIQAFLTALGGGAPRRAAVLGEMVGGGGSKFANAVRAAPVPEQVIAASEPSTTPTSKLLAKAPLALRWESRGVQKHDPRIVHYDTVGGRQAVDVIRNQELYLDEDPVRFLGENWHELSHEAQGERLARILNRKFERGQVSAADMSGLDRSNAAYIDYDPFLGDSNGRHYLDGKTLFYPNEVEGLPSTYGASPSAPPNLAIRDIVNDPALRSELNLSAASPLTSQFHKRSMLFKRQGGPVRMAGGGSSAAAAMKSSLGALTRATEKMFKSYHPDRKLPDATVQTLENVFNRAPATFDLVRPEVVTRNIVRGVPQLLSTPDDFLKFAMPLRRDEKVDEYAKMLRNYGALYTPTRNTELYARMYPRFEGFVEQPFLGWENPNWWEHGMIGHHQARHRMKAAAEVWGGDTPIAIEARSTPPPPGFYVEDPGPLAAQLRKRWSLPEQDALDRELDIRDPAVLELFLRRTPPRLAAGGQPGKALLGGLESLFTRAQLRQLERLDPVNQLAMIRQAAQESKPGVLEKLAADLQRQIAGPLSQPDPVNLSRRKFLKQTASVAARSALPNVPFSGALSAMKMIANPEAAIEQGIVKEIQQAFNPKQMLLDLTNTHDPDRMYALEEKAAQNLSKKTLSQTALDKMQGNFAKHFPKGAFDAEHRAVAGRVIQDLGHTLPPEVDPRHVLNATRSIESHATFPHELESLRGYLEGGDNSALVNSTSIPEMDWLNYPTRKELVKGIKNFPTFETWSEQVYHPHPVTKQLGLTTDDMNGVYEALHSKHIKNGENLHDYEAPLPEGTFHESIQNAHELMKHALGVDLSPSALKRHLNDFFDF